MTNQENVLVYSIGQLGDTLVGLPAMQEVAKRHPNARLTLLTDRHPTATGFVSSWDVIKGTGLFDEVIFYSPGENSRAGKYLKTIWLLFRLRTLRLFCVYNLARRTTSVQVERDRWFFEKMAGAKKYFASPELESAENADPAALLRRKMPEWQRKLELVGGASSSPEHIFHLGSVREGLLEELRIVPGNSQSRFVAMAPGAKLQAKCWPEGRFAELGELLLSKHPDLKLLLLGGSGEEEIGERLVGKWGGRSSNLAGKLSVQESAAVLKHCALYIGNDTGTMHLAAMSGVACVALFSARDYPGLWEPYGSTHTIVRRTVDCAGCGLDVCNLEGHPCLGGIQVDEVAQAAQVYLGGAAR